MPRANAQSLQMQGITPAFQAKKLPDAKLNLKLDDWRKAIPKANTSSSGITLYFDYTKIFEWLIPKKNPKIPRDCDPKYFLDSIPRPPPIKKDSIPASMQPV